MRVAIPAFVSILAVVAGYAYLSGYGTPEDASQAHDPTEAPPEVKLKLDKTSYVAFEPVRGLIDSMP